MIVVKRYDNTKTYMYPNGALATPEVVLNDYPACAVFTFIVETDETEEVIYSFQNLNAMRSFYNIDPSLNEDEAVAAIQHIRNNPPAPEEAVSNEEITATALASIAASLEYQNMMTLPDEEV